ncbi:MAG: dihydropteroate synthase [Lachnospiraceae bacterium]|nr:dihydropteroate synthase [Lachnospiraceae bacterium]
MIIGNKVFDTTRQGYIMGILNVTPDSFSDGGNYNNLDNALFQTEKMIKEGAAIIDVGGESTRPDHVKITDQEEIERVVPVIEAIKSRFDTTISLDTYKSPVAIEGIKAGAHLINDVWGLKWDGTMAKVIADAKVACCLMHNRHDMDYKNFMDDVMADLAETMDMAAKAGIEKDKIMLDPGVGFAKTLEQNRLITKEVGRLCDFGVDVLLGTSRKRMIGMTLDLPVDQREEGTMATTVLGYMSGCRFFRVHNVEMNYRALKMTEAILNQE